MKSVALTKNTGETDRLIYHSTIVELFGFSLHISGLPPVFFPVPVCFRLHLDKVSQ